jgi:beta-fructofuranosidase
MRLAVSKDLYDWKLKGNVFYQKNGSRDPSIFVHNGKYYMVYCSQTSVLLRESDDMLSWSDAKVIFTADIYDPESPSLVFHNGTYYLVVCSWDHQWDGKELVGAYQENSYVLQSDDMFDFGENAEKQVAELKGHAPEIFQGEDGQWYLSSVEWPTRGVSVDKVTWVEQ